MIKSISAFSLSLLLLPSVMNRETVTPAPEKMNSFRIPFPVSINTGSTAGYPAVQSDPASLQQSNWYSNAVRFIEESEYHFTSEEEQGAYCTSNRRNNLLFRYTPGGFTVQPARTKLPEREITPGTALDAEKYTKMSGWKVSFLLDKKIAGNGTWNVKDNKAEYITTGMIIQYINSKEGMRQNFIVPAPLSADNVLQINFRVNTSLKTCLHGNQLQFIHPQTGNVLNYDGLKVWDARGKELAASIEKTNTGYCIKVLTAGAAYPVIVDPLSSTPDILLDDADQAGARFGTSVASAGDVNGDGFSDVIIGAPAFDDGGNTDEGRAFVYYGRATGLANTPGSILHDANQAAANFGAAVSSAGDVNGDGYSDVIIGAPEFDDGGNTDEGRAFVYHGSAGGLLAAPSSTPDDANSFNTDFGASVACAGDVNGDGYSDVIIGAPLRTDGGSGLEGVAYVYHGSATGISASPASTPDDADKPIASFGCSVASAGDVNGDGYSDVIIGSERYDKNSFERQAGRAYLYIGSATGLAASPAATLAGEDQGASYFGHSVASSGDVNGDGFSDVVIGAYLFDASPQNRGRAYIYYGSGAGLSDISRTTLQDSQQTGEQYGVSVASAGDVNGDGYSDVIIGAYGYDDGANTDEGRAFAYLGSATGIVTTPFFTAAHADQVNAQFGFSVASAGDVNGDGYSDVIIGSYLYDDGANTDEGTAFVYFGSAGTLSLSPQSTPDDANQAGATFGFSVASAGDVNSDGFSDIIIGAPGYMDGANANEGRAYLYLGSASGLAASPAATLDHGNQNNAFFGYSVSSAGDVNGDGYSDVITGSPGYTDGGNSFEGRCFVYYGSAAGLSASPNSTPDDADQASAQFGYSVSSAGDVNGDGYSDIIIGSDLYNDGANTDEGRAFVYYGSATGLSASPNSTPDDANQASANFGRSVAGAGDVNGDGYSDVVIGALNYDDGANTNEGRAFVYYGSAAGLSAAPNSTPDDADQAFSTFGVSVASAGDVNGDGFDDIIIGAYIYDDGASTDEGRAFVYHGSAAGLSGSPNSIPDDADQASAAFGFSVASAGDINDDGYGDVVIGALNYDDGANNNEGRAFVYYGSPTGLAPTPADTPDDGDQAFIQFGYNVSSAGDVNGDGYSDVIIGAIGYIDGGNIAEGRVFVYHGNRSAATIRNNIRLYNTDLSTPVNISNAGMTQFGTGLFAKSFLGRQDGKLVWETRISYGAYSGTPITNSVLFTAQQNTFTDLFATGTELKNLVSKVAGARYTKLRARVKYSLVTAITGQVYGPWRYISSVIDGPGMGVLPVNLLSFKAGWLQKGKSADIGFSTDNDNGTTCCFDIEKSTDGITFTTISSLPATNLPGVQHYRYTDNNATATKQYYRLKIKEKDGGAKYSNMALLEYDGASEIIAFPNPANDMLQLELNKAYGKFSITVLNSTGQVVKRLNSLPANNRLIKIPVHDLSAGVYWLQLQTGTEKQTIQFIKQ